MKTLLSRSSAEALDGTPPADPGLDRASPVDSWPEVVYTPGSELRAGHRLIGATLRGFAAGRELAWQLFQRNVRGMYRQTLLGFAWAFLPPLANTLIWVFLHNQRVLEFDQPLAVPYAIYVLVGMVIWQTFVESLQMPLNLYKQNRGMIAKLNFPREALLLVGWGEIGMNLAIRLAVLLPVLWIWPPVWSWGIWMFPCGLALLIALGTALGLWLMPLGVLYHDVEKLLAFGLPLWMILTPIIFPVDAEKGLAVWHWLNPPAGLLVAARDGLILGATHPGAMAIVYGLLAIPLLLLGLLLYRLSIPVLIERAPG